MVQIKLQFKNMIQDEIELVENPNMYAVQKILKRRTITKGNTTKIQYYVKWENYDSDDNTWEPAENLATVPQMIEKFQKKLAEKKQAQDNKQANKNKLWGSDSTQNVSLNEERYERENGYKLRKQQSGSSKNISQTFQQIKQAIPDISSTRQAPKQPRQIPRKQRNIDSHSEFGSKSKSYIEQEVRIQKEIKTIKQKQLKMNPLKDSNDKKQKSMSIYEQAYGKIVNHVYKDGQLYFEVQKLSHTQKIAGIQLLSKEEVERSCIQGAYQYFYKLLVSLQEART